MTHEEFFGTHVAARQLGAYTMCLRDYAESARLPEHEHGRAFATIVIHGGLRELSSGGTVDCGPQGVLVHAPGARHTNRFVARRTRCLSVQGGAFARNACLATPAAASIAVKLLAEFRDPDAMSPIAVDALMQELFVDSERRRSDDRAPRWLKDVRIAIAQRFQEPPSLAELAQTADVHPGHLARAFRARYGTSIGDFVRELRVAYARQRLDSPDPLHAIAHDAGFADQSHFTRTFRRATGMTPARYRETLRASHDARDAALRAAFGARDAALRASYDARDATLRAFHDVRSVQDGSRRRDLPSSR